MAKLKVIVAAGVPPAEAIKAALGCSIRDFAARAGLVESTVSGVINGSTPYPYHSVRDALAKELEVERAYIDELLPLPEKGEAA